MGWRHLTIALLGAIAAGGVGWTTSANANPIPAHGAVLIRVVIIATLIAAGLYARTSTLQARMGGQLIAAGFFSAFWLLNGSGNRVLFSIGVVCTVLAPAVFAYLMLAHPVGRLRPTIEWQFVWRIGAVATVLWFVAILVARQPPLKTPLIQCGLRCPDNAFSLGSAAAAPAPLKAGLVLLWMALTCGVPLLLYRRLRSAPALLRLATLPVFLTSVAYGVLVIGYLGSVAAGAKAQGALGTAYISCAVGLPFAFLIGLGMERLAMAQVLTEFVSLLGRRPEADPQALMASVLGDPLLRIAYQRPVTGTYVDSSGVAVDEFPDDHAVTWVEQGGRRVAAIIYSRDLAGQERLVQAAGTAALMRLEKVRLKAELEASTAEMVASRVRMTEAAHAERRRLERDLHDGVQQQLVGMRIKLDLAAEAMQEDPSRAELALNALGVEMDTALKALRLVAHGIYPELLHDRGLADALRAAARNMPRPASFRASGIGRYDEDVELAVYYCCLEALQNTVKHAGRRAGAALRLWEDGSSLLFELRDSGGGYDASKPSLGSGLINMRDRVQTVGGTVEIVSRKGRGTTVRGCVPVA